MSKNFNCQWLIKKGNFYICCDSRSMHHGEKLNNKEIMEPACPFFHRKKLSPIDGKERNP